MTSYFALCCKGGSLLPILIIPSCLKSVNRSGQSVFQFCARDDDSPQRLDVTWSAKTGRWYVFDNAYWRGLLSDASIKRPDASSSW